MARSPLGSVLEPVDGDWLVTFIDAYAAQAQRGAQPGTAVTPAQAESSRPPVAGRVARADREQIAGRLWQVFSPGPDRAVVLDALVRETGLRPVVQQDGSLRWAHGAADRSTRFLAACTATVLDLVTSRGWEALGTCAAGDCEDVHLAPPRGRPRRFCSTSCLNRSKARHHRARGRADR